MKKRAKIITILALVCCCFLICSCGGSAKSPNSGSDVENSDSTPIESDTSSDTSDDENGGKWTEEMPLN